MVWKTLLADGAFYSIFTFSPLPLAYQLGKGFCAHFYLQHIGSALEVCHV
jgi:hypothetical protein